MVTISYLTKLNLSSKVWLQFLSFLFLFSLQNDRQQSVSPKFLRLAKDPHSLSKLFSFFAISQKTYYFTHLFTFLFPKLLTDRVSWMKAIAWCYYSKYSLLLMIAQFHLWINFLRLLCIPWSYYRDMAFVKYHMNLAPCWNFLSSALSDRFRLAGVLVYLL